MLKNNFILFFLISNNINVYTQIVEVRYMDYNMETPTKLAAYDITCYEFDKIVLKDTFSYNFVSKCFSNLQYYCDTCITVFPDVRRQIILINEKEYYKILSYDQSSMELNGQPVIFDKQLYNIIEDIIIKHEEKKNLSKHAVKKRPVESRLCPR